MLSLWTENRTVTVLLELIFRLILLSRDFFHAFLYTFVVRFHTLLYIIQMRFYHQLMRFHKTALHGREANANFGEKLE